MKRLLLYLVILILISPFTGCNQIEDGSYVEPITLYEKINGNWALSGLTMVDNIAKVQNLELFEQNISSEFNFDQMVLEFNVDAEDNPSTFSVSGDIPPLFLYEGYWDLSSSFPKTDLSRVKVNLYSDASRQNKVDELELTITPGATDELGVELVRRSEGIAFLTYAFSFSSVNANQ
jgi:hypothetical protein